MPPVLHSCPACASTRLQITPPSPYSPLVIVRCRSCGLRQRPPHSPALDAVVTREAVSAAPVPVPVGAGVAIGAATSAEPVPVVEPVVEPVIEPAAAAPGDGDSSAEYDYAAYVSVMRASAVHDDRQEVLDRLLALTASLPQPDLFDVGGGDGTFAALARERGLAVSGNELSLEAINLARERHDVTLHFGTLDQLDHRDEHAIMTMWCILAHVDDGEALLRDAYRALRPGGILFLQTPHYSAIDHVATRAFTGSRGRLSRFAVARLGTKHHVLHTRRSMHTLLSRVGFTDVETLPRARYSLTSEFYLQALGLPAGAAVRTGRVVDRAIRGGAAPRIVMDVYARKPFTA
ncbi:methyltransferase domain-containing protein [Nocardioides sp.]|uniref:class I SAM-dependent methyltransferase n=1 Tax=Nocardioides sp. TaxID=35761 RepID=UPI0035158B46